MLQRFVEDDFTRGQFNKYKERYLRNVATNEIRWNPPRNGFVEGKTKPSSLEKKWFRCMIGECCSRQYFSIEEGALCSKGHFICIADFSKHCESQVEDDVLAQFEKQGEAILCPSYGKTKCKPFTDEEVSRFVNLKAFESIVRARMKVLKRSKEKEIEDRIKHEVSDREKKRVLSAREKLIDEKCSLVQEILNMNKCPSCRCDILEEEYQLSCSCNGCKINFCCYCKKSFSSSDEALEHTCCCPKGLGSMNQGKGNFQHMMIRRIKNCLRRVCRDDHRVFEGVVERLHDELDKLSISVDPKTVSLKCSLHHCCVGVEAKFLEEDGISCSNGHFLCSDDFSRYCKEKLQLESRDKFEADEGKIYCPLREEGGCRLSRAFGVKEIAEHTTDDIFKTLMKIRANLLASNEKRVRNGPRKECQIYAECDTDTLHQDDGIECSNGHFICAKDFTRLVESQTEILLRFEEKGGMVRCPFFDKGCNSEPFTDDEIKLTSVDAFEALMKGRMRLKESVYAREIEGLQRKLRDYENKEAMEFPERRKRDIQDACQYITENILNVHCPGYKHVYAEVEGGDCMATTYGTYFCGYCEEMEETSHQAHEHTSQCLERPGSYFPSNHLENLHRYLRTKRIQRYLDDTFLDDDIYDSIIENLQPQLIRLGIDIQPRNSSTSEIIEDCDNLGQLIRMGFDVHAATIALDEAGGVFEEAVFELLRQEVDIEFEEQTRDQIRWRNESCHEY